MDTKLKKAGEKVASTVAEHAQQKAEANGREASYAASTRQHRMREKEQNRIEWIEFHTRLYLSHARLASEHAAEAMALQDGNTLIERS